ncbi:NusG domain II-containing protein [Sporolactobacillus vineae]|uniref:NusG domain II-containing protein n=1 Tax=Sporolactobacillus vineae TaxID=444463 RepID=UPI0002893562|nr:NusG domain II-containing protein [Sporolactobacillus vineae]
MARYLKMIRPWDIIIVCVLVLISFLPVGMFSYVHAREAGNASSRLIAVVSLNNKQIRQVVLTGNTKTEEFTVYTKSGDYNTIEVNKNRIRIKKANCPDQICVRTGYISEPGQTIVCLPHRVVIEIHRADRSEAPVIVSS